MCSTRAAPAWFEWSELFKLFDWVEFFSKIIFRANGEKNNLKKFNEIKKFKKQAQLLNQAGAALVLHIKWWRALFFRCLNLASKKDGAFDILLLRCWFYLLRQRMWKLFGCFITEIWARLADFIKCLLTLHLDSAPLWFMSITLIKSGVYNNGQVNKTNRGQQIRQALSSRALTKTHWSHCKNITINYVY